MDVDERLICWYGGESGIRSLGHPVDSVSYTNHITRDARNASVAVGPCSFLPPYQASFSNDPARTAATTATTSAPENGVANYFGCAELNPPIEMVIRLTDAPT